MTVKEYIEILRGVCIKIKGQEVISFEDLRILRGLEKAIETAEEEHTGSIGVYDFEDECLNYPPISFPEE